MKNQENITQSLRQRGYRITPQREIIIRVISHSDKHMSAEEIYTEVQKSFRSTNIATVYRTLDLLFKEGLACRNDLGGGKEVYATLNHGTHIHLVCRKCGHVIDANYALLKPLQDELLKKYHFKANLTHISIYGLCEECQKQQNDHLPNK